uniref:Uncharacterized protein n=1 Tax=Anguilla anguilla TaxID=7936 RepID=A0A0E9S3T0_ANGAN
MKRNFYSEHFGTIHGNIRNVGTNNASSHGC